MVQDRLRIVGYTRVSTDAQVEQGQGLEIQEAEVRAWARRCGHRLVDVLADEGVSGANSLDGRLALPEAIRQVRDGRADGIVVYRLDRLARDLVLQETLLAEIWRLGGSVHSVSEAETAYLADDPEDPSRRLIRQVLGAVSEYERAMIGLRLRAGRRHKAVRGGFAYGSPAFGCRSENGTLVDDDREQRVVGTILQFHASGMSQRRIAEELNAALVPTKRVGSRWHPTTVGRVLDRANKGTGREVRSS